MFAKGTRVTTEEFDVVMKQGRIFHVPHFTLRLIEEKGLTKSLFSVVAPKSVTKLAVSRNKLKRQMRVALKGAIQPDLKGYKGILFAKKGVTILPYSQIKDEIVYLVKKAGILE